MKRGTSFGKRRKRKEAEIPCAEGGEQFVSLIQHKTIHTNCLYIFPSSVK
jgi:hypothetical protein